MRNRTDSGRRLWTGENIVAKKGMDHCRTGIGPHQPGVLFRTRLCLVFLGMRPYSTGRHPCPTINVRARSVATVVTTRPAAGLDAVTTLH